MIPRRKLITDGFFAAGLLFLPQLSQSKNSQINPVVNSTHGPVRGFRDRDINIFRGIRYGADTSKSRFMPPRSPQSWVETIEVFEYGSACPQGSSNENISEDCLFLNVWTPQADPPRQRPVMFYIHGGAYAHGSGSSPLYDGCELARRGDVVVVTVNHRLNAFGYLYLQRFDKNFAIPVIAGSWI